MNPCRLCGAQLRHSFCDLGMSPPSNAFLRVEQLNAMERFYPLHAWVCGKCKLVQLEEFETPERLFADDYPYFSSYSETWLRHGKAFVSLASERFSLGVSQRVIEIGSNDGYLLQFFKERGLSVLGIEPAANVALAAEERGIQTRIEFFGTECARRLAAEGIHADLMVGNNVLAHVPALNDFVEGIRLLLSPNGVATLELPHLLRLMQETQFDTIYHEHFSYFSLTAAERLFSSHAMRIFDVDELPTHGGSLRLYICHAAAPTHHLGAAVAKVHADERAAGLDSLSPYSCFQEHVLALKCALLEFLIDAKRAGKRIAAYGAAAKGNTLLNYCGVGGDFLDYVADLSPHKQGKFLPGTHIPVVAPARIRETRPDYLLILPWNIKDEVMAQNAFVREWGGRFVIPIPRIAVL